MEEVPGSGKFFPAQLVFLALGFLGPKSEAPEALGIKQDARSNIQTPPKVCFANIYHDFELHDPCRNTRQMLKVSLRPVTVAVVSR
jgi:glutamate synthase (NADPH/NADH)